MISKIKQLLKSRRPVKYIVRIRPHDREIINRLTKIELAQTKAKNVVLQKKLEKLEDEKAEEEIIRKAEEEVRKVLKRTKHIKKKVIFKLEGKKPLFFLFSNGSAGKWKYFYGIAMEETEKGYIFFYPVLTDETGKDKVILPKPVTDVMDIFKNKVAIVSSINAGKVDSAYDVCDGRILVANQLYNVEGTHRKIKVIDLSDYERRQYIEHINKLQDEIDRLRGELASMKEIKEEIDSKMFESEIETSAALKKADIWQTKAAELVSKQVALTRAMSNLLASYQDIAVSGMLTDKQNWILMDALDKARQELSKSMHVSDRDKEFNRILEQIERVRDLIDRGVPVKVEQQGEKGGGEPKSE